MDLIDRQPEKRTEEYTETHACDSISRQAAIDEAEEWIEVAYCEDGDQRERNAIRHVINAIKKLPSVQPEPNYCRDCKWSRCHINVDKHGKTETYWRCLNWDGETEEEGYCYEWERRTDEQNS